MRSTSSRWQGEVSGKDGTQWCGKGQTFYGPGSKYKIDTTKPVTDMLVKVPLRQKSRCHDLECGSGVYICLAFECALDVVFLAPWVSLSLSLSLFLFLFLAPSLFLALSLSLYLSFVGVFVLRVCVCVSGACFVWVIACFLGHRVGIRSFMQNDEHFFIFWRFCGYSFILWIVDLECAFVQRLNVNWM